MDSTPRSNIRFQYFAIGWALVIIGLSSIPGEDIPSIPIVNIDKLAHMGVYGILGGLIALTLQHQSKYPLLFKNALLASIVIGSLYGVTDELHQLFVPGRSCDIWDWTADTVGVILGVFILPRLWRLYGRRSGAVEGQ